jgi:hypothetical protein
VATFYQDQRLAGMGQIEANIWTRFLEEHGGEFTDYQYNFRLIKPIQLPDAMEKQYKANAIALSALRVDVVMQSRDAIYIVEVRPDARQSAIGGLLMYRYLYILQENPPKEVRMLLVTNKYDPAIELTCRIAGIGYFIY